MFQRPYLFEGSVLDSITLSKAAPLEEVRRAAALAVADESIQRLSRKYESQLAAGGANLSGGQAQRLGIARALFRDAPVLILDEATSNLDSATEAHVWENIRQVRAGKTTVIISHRLSTVLNCDRIYVLEKGRNIESGIHQELMERRGVYHRIFRWQAHEAGVARAGFGGAAGAAVGGGSAQTVNVDRSR
ncbi:MAG: ATP-binding cassette domain-containing protein [Symbiobacterium sp.]|uniref:ATP-binding cassette domain-containing protein n=1 Tax=Symbiobacterium sp. TaxID=1971213 RepID=UPI0034646E95